MLSRRSPDRPTGQPIRLAVGVVDVLPKLVVRRLLEPALSTGPAPVRLVCYENNYEKLLSELGGHNLDVVLADAPVPTNSPVRAFHHLLGESGITFFAKPSLASKYKKDFPIKQDNIYHFTEFGFFDEENEEIKL